MLFRSRLTPTLRFIYDEVPAEATEIEDVLTAARHRDEAMAEARVNASYAGDPDPYRHDDEEGSDESAAEGADEVDR